MSADLGWGIVGPGTIAANFAAGLAEVPGAHLAAIGGRDRIRRDAFGDRWGVAVSRRHDSYETLVADPSVDAVYVATPHPFHLDHGLLAISAGKALMVEKPAGITADEVVRLTDAAEAKGVFFMEAFKCRCHPQMARLAQLIADGHIGRVHRMRATYGFAVRRDSSSRLFDPALGGGAILDIGCYTVAAARLVAGAAIGRPFAEPESVQGQLVLGPTGVDESARARLVFPGGVTVEIACSIVEKLDNLLEVDGSHGRISLPDPWRPGRDGGPSDADILIETPQGTRTETIRDPRHLFAFEIAAATEAIRGGRLEADWPAMSREDSRGNAAVLDAWRALA